MSMSPSSPQLLERLGFAGGLSRVAVILIVVCLALGLLSFEAANAALLSTKAWVLQYFDWLFVLVVNIAIAIVVLCAVHPKAKLRLGAEGSQPEFSRLSWFAMLFSAGLASGLLYWAAAEPIIHLGSNPLSAHSDTEAARLALRITVVHWGIHGWALYVLAALAISIYHYRGGQALAFRTALFPLLGPGWIDRWPGRGIDLLALLGTVAGVATSIGLSAGSINSTLAALFSVPVEMPNQIFIIFGTCALGVISALTGVARGIRFLSQLNLWVSSFFLLAFFLLGPTYGLVVQLIQTLIDYSIHGIPTGLWIGTTAEARAWQGDWTVFYWGWWLAWTPFVSLFIARISKGRSIREFALAVLLVPSLLTVIWMVVIGGTAISLETSGVGAIAETVARDYSLGLVAVIEQLGPLSVTQSLIAVAAFLLLSWLITSLDSATLVICHLLDVEGTPAAKVFWGVALAAVASVLLAAGGLSALQAASVILGLPLAGIVFLIGLGLVADLVRGRIS